MGFQLDPKDVTKKFGVPILSIKTTPAPAAPAGADAKGGIQVDPDNPNPVDPVDEDKDLKASDLIKLHAKIIELYGGSYVH
jgi:hypothetical protein